MICGWRWGEADLQRPRMALVHHCARDAPHDGEMHACRCGASAPLGHDDAETQAVEES